MLASISAYLSANPALHRLYKNAGILFGGNIASGGFNLLCIAILNRALGLETFGVYALVTAYISLIDRLVSFQTWQALIHYGSQAIIDNKGDRLNRLMFFGWILDAVAGIAGFTLAICGALLIPMWFGIDQAGFTTVLIAASPLIFNWVATPTAILRLYNKFYVQASYLNVIAIIRFGSMAFLWFAGTKTLLPYIICWTLSHFIGRAYLFITGWRLLCKNNPVKSQTLRLRALTVECPGLIKFLLTTNLDSTVRILRDLDIFIVNYVLGTAAAALYKISRELARVFAQLTGPFYQAIYPELSRMVSTNDMTSFRKLVRQSSLTLGGILIVFWLGFLVIGKPMMVLVFGADYAPAFVPALLCLAAMVVWGFSLPLPSALLALGKAQTNFLIHAATSLAYAPAVFLLSHTGGLVGASAAFFAFYVVWSTLMLLNLRKNLTH